MLFNLFKKYFSSKNEKKPDKVDTNSIDSLIGISYKHPVKEPTITLKSISDNKKKRLINKSYYIIKSKEKSIWVKNI